MLSLIVCVHLWGTQLKHLRIVVLCDNLSVCIAINSGKSRCKFLQSCLREICFVAASSEFEIRTQHISSVDNRIADHLSRWHKWEGHQQKFKNLAENMVTSECLVIEADCELKCEWYSIFDNFRWSDKGVNTWSQTVKQAGLMLKVSRKNLKIQWESFLMFCNYSSLCSLPVSMVSLQLYAVADF